MKKSNLKIDILPNQFLNDDGTFNKEEAISLCGKIAGICYSKDGFEALVNEPQEKTQRRVKMTLYNGHHSVYDHIMINFNIKNLPKILAMVINNENEYTTSEKSARYTPVVRRDDMLISKKEEDLYNKWLDIFKDKIKDRYQDVYNDNKIVKLAQENARYLVSVFMPTEMIYSTTLRQINYIASWMKKYVTNYNKKSKFEKRLANAMNDFLDELSRLNVLEEGLMSNEKNRSLSLFGKDLDKKEEYFGNVYSTTYTSSLAYLAQAHRHRTLDYQMEFLDNNEFFIPPIIADDEALVNNWIMDMNSVRDVTPQGLLVRIYEIGSYENFILKCKERLCSAAQLEIMLQTKSILQKYQKALEKNDNPLKEDIKKYSKGARCTFPDFKCSEPCNFKEGITNTRII